MADKIGQGKDPVIPNLREEEDNEEALAEQEKEALKKKSSQP